MARPAGGLDENGGGVVIVSAIAAVGEDGAIGRAGALPWSLPADLKRFRALTWGKPIIMGRKTHGSLGRALPGRTNIVLSRSTGPFAAGCQPAGSPEEALEIAASTGADEAFVIGGEAVFRALLPRCERLYLTIVEGRFDGDAFFPWGLIDRAAWRTVQEEEFPADARNAFSTRFQILHRPGPPNIAAP